MNPLPAMPIACTQIKLLYAFILSAILDKSHEKKNVVITRITFWLGCGSDYGEEGTVMSMVYISLSLFF